ncbi:MAG: secretin N-terminal domain-containing protein [Planctomycetota bacterium]
MGLARSMLVACSMTLGFGSSLGSQESARPDQKSDQPRVTNIFYDTSVRQALADIAAQTGVTIVPDQSVQGLVTCELNDVPLHAALDIILAGGGFAFREKDGYILVGSTHPDSPHFFDFSETRHVQLNYVKAEEAVKMLPASLEKLVKPCKSNNTVCVVAPPDVVNRVVTDLKTLDKPPRQVLLEARVVELATGTLTDLGLDWSYEWVKNLEEPIPEGGRAAWDMTETQLSLGFTKTASYTRTLLLRLTLLCDNEWATIVANPRITAQDGAPAEIKVATEEYFIILTDGAWVRSELQKVESGIILAVTPRIGDNGDITLEVSPEVSNVIGKGTQNLPLITRRRVSTTVRVKDGGTVVIAGLLSNLTRTTTRTVPVLGDIPLLGWLFQREAAYDAERQVAVFITPRIVGERSEAERDATRSRRPPRRVGPEFHQELQESVRRYMQG